MSATRIETSRPVAASPAAGSRVVVQMDREALGDRTARRGHQGG